MVDILAIDFRILKFSENLQTCAIFELYFGITTNKKTARQTNNHPPAMSKRAIADAEQFRIHRRNEIKTKVAGNRRTAGDG